MLALYFVLTFDLLKTYLSFTLFSESRNAFFFVCVSIETRADPFRCAASSTANYHLHLRRCISASDPHSSRNSYFSYLPPLTSSFSSVPQQTLIFHSFLRSTTHAAVGAYDRRWFEYIREKRFLNIRTRI